MTTPGTPDDSSISAYSWEAASIPQLRFFSLEIDFDIDGVF
jgi:hypothetical protein